MADSKPFRGALAAPLMPQDEAGRPRFDKYVAHCRWLLDQGCHGLMPVGSTGEAHSFTVKERIATMDALAASDIPVSKMLIGTSALNREDAVTLAKHATSLGPIGVCMQAPFYYKPASEDGLVEYFSRVVDEVNDDRLRLYIYDWEPNIGIHYSLECLERLFAGAGGKIVGIKDSNGDHEQIRARCEAFPEREVFSGTDVTGLTGLRSGSVGMMSAFANILAPVVGALNESFQGEDGDRLQAKIDQILAILMDYPVFGAIKEVLCHLTGDPVWRNSRPPVMPLPAAQAGELIRRIEAAGLGLEDQAA